MFYKNTRSKKAIIFLAAASLFIISTVPSLAGWEIGSAPEGLFEEELGEALENIIVGILGFLALLGILFIVYGGVRYVTSAGDEAVTEEAKKIIMNAAVGLFLTAAAYAIVKTVVGIIG